MRQPKQQVEKVVLVAEEPGSAENQGRRGLTATAQVAGHRFRQQETCELGTDRGEDKYRQVVIP